MEEIYQRRSIRKYKTDIVEKEKLDQILNAARMAPSGKNRQPWEFIVFGGADKMELLNQMEMGIQREQNEKAYLPASKGGLGDAANTLRIMREAPIVVIVLNTNGGSPMEAIDTDGRFAEIVDSLSIGAAIENMLLEATKLEIGSLWIANTCFAYPELIAYLKTSAQLVGAVALGYGLEAPKQRPRKSLEEIVTYRIS